MKAVFAYIVRDGVAAVVDLLRQQNVRCLSVVEVRARLWPAATGERLHMPELSGVSVADAKLEIVCEDDVLPAVLKIIGRIVHNRALGTGGVFVMDVAAMPMAPEAGGDPAASSSAAPR